MITTLNSNDEMKSVFLSKMVFQKGTFEEQQRYVLFLCLLGYCCGGKNYFPERALQKHFPLAECLIMGIYFFEKNLIFQFSHPLVKSFNNSKLEDPFFVFMAFIYEV